MYADYPKDRAGKVFFCKVIRDGEIIANVPCYSDETVLHAFEKEGLEEEEDYGRTEKHRCYSQQGASQLIQVVPERLFNFLL